MKSSFCAAYLFLIALLAMYQPALSQDAWAVQLPGVGTFSSPRVVDLNQDGIGDVILGAGREEFITCDSAVIALDGRTGEMLWHVGARDQIFGSAAIGDLTDDGIPDVLINGRSAELKAINGATGEVIWEFVKGQDLDALREAKWYNFYNPQFVPDQNGDGYVDILISNGGDVMAEPYDSIRPVGHLMVIDARTGDLLKIVDFPDGKETYMSLIAVSSPDHKTTKVIYGTGGETIGGHLYATTLAQIMNDQLDQSVLLATGTSKGFIGPPVWVDITGDQVHDLVACSVDGRMMAFDGTNYEKLWQADFPNTEIYSSISVGQFAGDSTPDFFISIAAGVWPKLEWNRQFMVNGANGAIEYTDSLGFYQTSTAVVLDVDGNGLDEVLLSMNYQIVDTLYRKFFENMLVVIDFSTGEHIQLTQSYPGNNISSTPWIGDLNGNGNLDIIYCHGTNQRHTYTFDGLQVNYIPTQLAIKKPPVWGSYMGSNYDGVFPLSGH